MHYSECVCVCVISPGVMWTQCGGRLREQLETVDRTATWVRAVHIRQSRLEGRLHGLRIIDDVKWVGGIGKVHTLS